MNKVEILLLGIALAMDCMTVSIAAGVSAKRWVQSAMIRMALSFGIFQGGMTLLGYFGISMIEDWIAEYDHWIAFALLMYLGINMIRTIWEKDEEKKMGLLSSKNVIPLSIATSIDALAVGISLACTNTDIIVSCIVIGICSLVLSLVGFAIGIGIGRKMKIPAEPIGGVVLIMIGLKVLMEHL